MTESGAAFIIGLIVGILIAGYAGLKGVEHAYRRMQERLQTREDELLSALAEARR